MSEAMQLFLVDPVVKLTDRQRRALAAITAAGYGGLSSDEVGGAIHQHPNGDVCQWCPSAGLEVGKALRAKRLVKRRRATAPGRDTYMVWVTVDAKASPQPAAFNEFPEGY